MNVRALAARAGGLATCTAAGAAALLVRVTLGQAFMLTGLGKLRNLERTTGFFDSLGIPLPGVHAVGIGCLELVGGALLIVGFVVRPVAALLLATMAVAILTADRAGFTAALATAPETGLTDVVPWMYALLLLGLLGHGAGRISIDRLVWGQPGTVPAQPSAASASPAR